MKKKIEDSLSEKELIATLDKAICKYSGDTNILEMAVGALMVGRHVGWKALLLIHDRKTIKKYETALGIDFKEILPEVGVYAERSLAWRTVEKIGGFWKAVKGEAGAGIRTNKIDSGK